MIYLFYGDDEFSLHEHMRRIKGEIGSDELVDANTTTLDGATVTPQQLLEASAVIPFLAERRLIIVWGLFQRFSPQRERGRSGRKGRARGQAADEWAELPDMLTQVPDTTVLVFADGPLRRDNPLLRQMVSHVEVRTFPLLKGQDLAAWIRQRMASAGATINEPATRLLAEYVGGDLWVMSGEVEKLALYSQGEEISEEAVRLLVGHSREASIFDIVDAVLGGKASAALLGLRQLLESGADSSYVIVMLARQLRLVLLTQEFLRRRVPRAELGVRLGLNAEFAVRRTEQQAKRHASEQIKAMYSRLLDTDLNIKQGVMADGLALEILVAELGGGATLDISTAHLLPR
ncbi:MAG: DNA polymerase III subunit delta [Chloroflexi bacterium]|nr:DNA polymerase III subunit delta [Chloroflexota bacterium]